MLFPGFRFKPTDKEIITYFLRRKVVEREPLPPPLDGFVPDCKVVGKIEPWVLWEQSGGPNSSDQGVYFFTELKVKSTSPDGRVRYCRQIESGGTWSGSATDDVKDDEGNVIGLKRHLHYEKKGCDHDGEWLLDEFCIPESSTVVLCRLKKSPRFVPKAKPRENICSGKRKHSDSESRISDTSMKRARTEINVEPQTSDQSGVTHSSTTVVLDDEETTDSEVNMDDIQFSNELFNQLCSGEEKLQGTSDGEQPPMACEVVPTLQFRNVVSTVNLDCKLDLNAIAQKAPNVQYNPTKFAKLTLRMKEPKATALIFAAGKMVCTGAKSEEDSELAAQKFTRIVQNLGFPAKFKDFQVQNIVASCDLKFPIGLAGLAESATHGPCSTYNPDSFPGLTYRMKGSKIVIRVFMSGKIVVTGAKVRTETYAAFDHIYPILQQFRRKPTMI